MVKIQKIALTGGPCAGKTIVLDAIKERFGDDVILVSEVATQLLEVPYDQGGIGVPGRDLEWSQEWQDRFQAMIIEKQLADEMFHVQQADLRERPTIVVCDRGVLDGAAYLAGGREEFLQKFHLEEGKCFGLYDTVIHLNSLATDNPAHYDELKTTNPSRFEPVERAKELDEKLFQVWEGHENHVRVPSADGVEAKIELCLGEIQKHFEKTREGLAEIKPEEAPSLPVS